MTEAILEIALLILLAKLLEEVAVRLRQPPLLGDVVAGLLLGPVVFSLVQPGLEIELFITIGIFFFFFLVGLEEIDIAGFLATIRTRLFIAACLAFLVPFSLGYWLSWFLGLAWVQSLAISSIIAISSLSVLAKVLTDVGRLRDHTGIQLFSVTVIVELLGLVLVSVAIFSGTPGKQFEALSFLRLLLQMVGFVLVAWVVGQWIVPRLLKLSRRYTKAREIPFGMLMGVLLLFVYFGDLSGVHGTIGALLLGIALSKTIHEFHFDVVRGFRNVAYGVFVPIFFAGAGLRLNFSFLELSALAVVGLIAVTVVGKYMGGLLAARIIRLEAPLASATGLIAKGALEIALLLSLLELGILGEHHFSLLIFITLLFLVVMPSIISLVFAKATRPEAVQEADPLIPTYVQMALGEIRVADVMSEVQSPIPEDMSVHEFVEKYLQLGRTRYIVTDKKGHLVGLLRADQIDLVPRQSRRTAQVKHLMDERHPVAYPEDPLYSVVEKMAEHRTSLMPVVVSESDNKILGVVPRTNIIQSLVQRAGGQT
jgi:Kef-type K+ transport system membrane component KefB/predicted transcriptional regulator